MSGYTTEEEYLDEDAVYIDYVGGPYGPPYNVPPQAPTPAPPAPAASSSEAKGKGKAKDEGAATLDQEIKERTEKEDTPERQANKEQLAKLASVRKRFGGLRDARDARRSSNSADLCISLTLQVDDFTVESLLRNDPTPTASLPTSTKIIKSLHLLQSMFQQANPDAPFPGLASAIPSFGGGFGARTPSPFPLETYASLLELLGSALQDVNSAPLAFSGAASSAARTKKTIYELQLERARLALNPDKAWVSPPTVMNNWGTVSPPSELTKEEKQMVDLSHLYSDQARAALLILRPPLFPPSPPEEPSSSTNPHLSTSTNAEGKTPSSTSSSSTCYISLLPSELLSHIFSLARALSAERLPLHGGHGGVGGYPGDPYDDYGAPRPIARRRPPGASSLEGSRTAAQRFALGLALTCRDWKAPARRIAFQSIHLRKAGQVEKLLKLVDGKGTPSAEGGEGGVREDLLGWVRKIDAKVVKAPDLGAGALAGIGVGRVRGYARFAGGMAWGVGGSSGGAGSAAAAKALEQEEETPAALFAKLVGKASGLRQLSLCVVGHPYSVGFGGRATIAEFLEPVSSLQLTAFSQRSLIVNSHSPSSPPSRPCLRSPPSVSPFPLTLRSSKLSFSAFPLSRNFAYKPSTRSAEAAESPLPPLTRPLASASLPSATRNSSATSPPLRTSNSLGSWTPVRAPAT